MKRPLIILGVLVAVAFLTVSLLKRKNVERTAAASASSSAEVARVKEFWAAYNRGNTLRAQDDFAQAVPAFRKALELNPQHEDSLYYLGASLYEIGKYREAASEFRKIIAANPASGRAWSELGNTLAIRAPGAPADFGGARIAYQHSRELNREQAGPFLRLGLLGLNRGRWDEARENFRLAAGFGSPEGDTLLAYTLFLERRDSEALPYLRKVLDEYSRDKKLTRRGVLSEGDVLPDPAKPLAALDKTALKAILLLDWESERLGGYPADTPNEFRVTKRPGVSPAFRALGAESGVKPGGRAAWADFDQNGRAGLIVAGPGQPIALYRNAGGKFSDATAAAGLGGVRNVWDAVWADYDRDGYPDLYLIRSGYTGSDQNLLYHNNRNGTFTDVTAGAGLKGARSTARACFADFTGSGHPDLVEVGAADSAHSSVRLYRNTGSGFLEITRQAGLESTATAVDCAAADFDRDGRQDLFVLYWKQNAALYHNDGGAKFSDATLRAGLAGVHGTSFSALFFDYDNDGWPDLLVSTEAPFEESVRCLLQPDFRATRDTARLFHNQKNGRFEEVTQAMGLERCYGTVQALAADFDSDGWTDLVLVNGSLDAERLEPSVVLRNEEGKRFKEWFHLPGVEAPSNFMGGTIADFNGDGKPDLYLAPNPLLPRSLSTAGLFANRLPENRTHHASRF